MQLVSAEAAAALDVTSAAFKSAQKELMLKAILTEAKMPPAQHSKADKARLSAWYAPHRLRAKL